MIDILWPLLLPLAAASGWLAAKWDHKKQAKKSEYQLPSAYFKGLNYLLNEQPDKAIEVFVKALEIDSETVETHLAVGNLFRRRGEVERATRIHQNLIARPNLDKDQRSQALFELAQDYLKAGLFDRAENLCLELAEVQQHGEQALRNLVHIYEQEKEWDKAISTSQRLARVLGEKRDDVIAQYYCELTEEARAANDLVEAEAMARRALSADRRCVRATMLLGHLRVRQGELKEAVKTWRKVEDQDPKYLGEVVDWISDIYRAQNDEDGLRTFLRAGLERRGGVKLMLALADVLERNEGPKQAEEFVVEWLRKMPTIQGLYRLIELKSAVANDKGKQDLELLQTIIADLLEKQLPYACESCGFTGKSLHWQCPSCKGWNTMIPILSPVAQ